MSHIHAFEAFYEECRSTDFRSMYTKSIGGGKRCLLMSIFLILYGKDLIWYEKSMRSTYLSWSCQIKC